MKKQRETSSRRNSKITTKTTHKVVVDIRPGSVSPAQQVAWRRFWAKIISEVKVESNKDE